MYIVDIYQDSFKPKEESVEKESEKFNMDNFELQYVETHPKEPRIGRRDSTIRTNKMILEDIDKYEKELEGKYHIPDKVL